MGTRVSVPRLPRQIPRVPDQDIQSLQMPDHERPWPGRCRRDQLRTTGPWREKLLVPQRRHGVWEDADECLDAEGVGGASGAGDYQEGNGP